jgi:hypothetical protein
MLGNSPEGIAPSNISLQSISEGFSAVSTSKDYMGIAVRHPGTRSAQHMRLKTSERPQRATELAYHSVSEVVSGR